MNKLKAFFAGLVILAVAGGSGTLWYLHDAGKLGNRPEQDSVMAQEQDGDTDKKNGWFSKDDTKDDGEKPDEKNTVAETTAADKNENRDKDSADIADINEFLSVFSRVYFAESRPYAVDSRSTYELIKFAYSHILRTDRTSIVTQEKNDNIQYYNSVSFDKVNRVLKEYLGVTVMSESVYTENDYMFFKYADGMFLTPAADGVGYTNLAIADSVEKDGKQITVDFTIYTSGVQCDMSAAEAHEKGEKYKSGTAVIRETADGYRLEMYEVK